MSIRCSVLYFSGPYSQIDERRHTIHIYREAGSEDYYIVDDANRNPIALSKKAAQEIVWKYEACRKQKKKR